MNFNQFNSKPNFNINIFHHFSRQNSGHVNYCATIANRLLSYENTEVHFALNQEFIDRFSKIVPKAQYHRYEFQIGDVPKEQEEKDPSKRLVQIVSFMFKLNI